MQILHLLLLVLSLACGITKNVVSKAADGYYSRLDSLMTSNMFTACLALIVYFASGFEPSLLVNPLFLLMALCYGLLTLGSTSFYIVAVKDGAVSVCALIYASCFIIPTVFSAFYDGEPLHLPKAVGIVLMLVSILAVSFKKDGTGEKKQIVFAVLAMLCAGCVGIMQKTFGNVFGAENINGYLFASFFFMLVSSFIIKAAISKGGEKGAKPSRKQLVCILLLAISLVFANKINIFLAGALPGIIFFPVINGGTVMCSAVISGIAFGEKISRLAFAGIVLGISAMVLIAM
ncbi:MAG: EamA family transporter [Clostridia bacterium]|nr:EamA family transporter [Clostridia bacterium]